MHDDGQELVEPAAKIAKLEHVQQDAVTAQSPNNPIVQRQEDTEDSKIEVIKKEVEEKNKHILAMFGVSQPSQEQEEDPMEKELTCAICSEIFYKPATVLPCLHNFCAHCLAAWIVCVLFFSLFVVSVILDHYYSHRTTLVHNVDKSGRRFAQIIAWAT